MLRHILFSTCLTASAAIWGATPFERVVDEITASNTELLENVASREADLLQMKAEGALEAPEVELERLWGTHGTGTKTTVAVSMGFDWPGVYAARAKALKQGRAAMAYLNETDLQGVRARVVETLLDIIYARQRIALQQKVVDSYVDIAEKFKKHLENNNVTRLDYNKAFIESVTSREKLENLKVALRTLQGTLEELNNGEPVDRYLAEIGTEYPVMALCEDSLHYERNPELAAAAAIAEMQRSRIDIEKKSLLPGFSAGYVYNREEGMTFHGFTLSATLPFLTGRSKLAAAKAASQAADFDVALKTAETRSSVLAEIENAKRLKKLSEEYGDIFKTDDHLELLRKAYDSRLINFITYAQEVNYFMEAQDGYLGILHDYYLAVARVERYH